MRKKINVFLAQSCFVLLFISGLGWLLDQFGVWERNGRFQRWLNRHDGLE